MNEQTPHNAPRDREAEQWVIGSVLLKPAILDDLGGVVADDFFHDDTRQLYAAMQEMYRRGEPIDVGLLGKRFPGDDWATLIEKAVRLVPVAGHARRYAEIVSRLAKARRIVQIAESAVDAVGQPDADPDAVVDDLERDLAGIRAVGERGEPVSLADAALEAACRIDEVIRRGHGGGLPTGLVGFDQDVGGLFPGELIVVAARPGVGKTSLALQIAHHNAAQNRPVYFASLEMSAAELS
ncbi:MAG: hypothetical protein GX621_04915, partial [Pirellulaceae bacterium]|nr:hypothetical protein [Pirellulaceae bacterium]